MLWIADMRSLALLLVFLLGCSTAASGSASTTPGTTADLASQLAMAFCACCGSSAGTTGPDGSANRDAGAAGSNSSCGSDTDATADDGGTSTCLARATLSANRQLALVTTAFSEGLLTINPAIETTCVSAYVSSGCAALPGQGGPDVQAAIDQPACATLFTGFIPIGERCDMTEECVADSYCLSQGTGQNVTSITGSGTLGVCFPFEGMGATCNTTEDCLPPLSCNATTFTCE
jgi:hypothetical protein